MHNPFIVHELNRHQELIKHMFDEILGHALSLVSDQIFKGSAKA
jgi:hypothetical protein